MLLTSRWILPVSSKPLKDGAIEIEGDRIKKIHERCPAKPTPPDKIVDLGEAILLPGLVNAHCHLEFSALKGILSPRQSFTQWVKDLSAETSGLTPQELEEGIDKGSQELLLGGTTTVVHHLGVENGATILNVCQRSPLRILNFLEILGVDLVRAKKCLEAALRLQKKFPGTKIHLTPHSLYSVHLEVLEKMFQGRHGGLPLQSIHLLESADEDQFFRQQKGPLVNYILERGGEGGFPFSSPIGWLIKNNPSILLIHGNYLTPREIALLRGTGVSVIHCPGSHRFFGHRPFPLLDLKNEGINLALGTDSLASNEGLNMFREMRLVKETYPELTAEEIVRMATDNGAKALRENSIGTIATGKYADLIAVRINQPFVDPYELVLQAKQAEWVMINGKVITLRSPLLR